MSDASHEFGGDHTDEKLERVRKYIAAYVTALKDQPFKRLYIDAFAGTGSRGGGDSSRDDNQQTPIFSEGDTTDETGVQELKKGSARIALEVDPPFDQYIFVEANRRHWTALKRLVDDYPALANRVSVVLGDANEQVTKICRNTNWRVTRAVVFLDPYGTQVDWSTIEAIAATEAVDLWYLFPFMAVVRMTPSDGNIPSAWADRLDRMLGHPDWRDVFYAEESDPDLFGAREMYKTTNVEQVEKYLMSRLKSVFPGVSATALRLPETQGRTMFLLVFACSNPKPAAQRLALRIANYILKR